MLFVLLPFRVLMRCIAIALLLAACQPAPHPGIAPDRATEAEAAARRAIAAERSIDPASIPERTVGVAPFALRGTDSTVAPLAYGLAELLMTDLARSARLQVVDRVRVGALLRELSMSSAGAVDSTTAPRVGRLVGARRIVIGSLGVRPDGALGLEARIANVATSDVESGISAYASLDDILDAEKALAFRVFEELGIILTPAERAAVEQRPTRSIAALLAFSRGVQAETRGDHDAAARAYQSAARIDPGFALAGERLSDIQVRTSGGSSEASGASASRKTRLQRAVAVAEDRVNRVYIAPASTSQQGTATDPAFQPQTVTVVIVLSTPP